MVKLGRRGRAVRASIILFHERANRSCHELQLDPMVPEKCFDKLVGRPFDQTLRPPANTS